MLVWEQVEAGFVPQGCGECVLNFVLDQILNVDRVADVELAFGEVLTKVFLEVLRKERSLVDLLNFA